MATKKGEQAGAAAAAATPSAREVHRPLTGAAKIAHDAKARGETVTVGKPFGGKRAAAAGSSSSTRTRPSGTVGILERVRRIV